MTITDQHQHQHRPGPARLTDREYKRIGDVYGETGVAAAQSLLDYRDVAGVSAFVPVVLGDVPADDLDTVGRLAAELDATRAVLAALPRWARPEPLELPAPVPAPCSAAAPCDLLGQIREFRVWVEGYDFTGTPEGSTP